MKKLFMTLFFPVFILLFVPWFIVNLIVNWFGLLYDLQITVKVERMD